MRKVMLLAAMLAMVLAAAVPAFAQQDTTVGGEENVVTVEGDEVQYSAVCQNVIGSIGDVNTNQTGEVDAVATDDSEANAELAQELGVSIATIEDCLDVVDVNGDGFVDEGEAAAAAAAAAAAGGGAAAAAAATASATASATATATATASPSATASAAATLPETGGASVIALGAGALLVAGGLLARRIVR